MGTLALASRWLRPRRELDVERVGAAEHRVPVHIQPEAAWIWTGAREVAWHAWNGACPDLSDANWRQVWPTISAFGGGGLELRMGAPPAIGTPIWLRFVLPFTGETLGVRGRIVRGWPADPSSPVGAAPHHVGVELEELPRVDQERLTQALVRALARLQREERRRARTRGAQGRMF